MLAVVALALLGAVLGWWPLCAWAERSRNGGGAGQMQPRTLRACSAVFTALSFALVTWRFWPSWLLPALLAFCAIAVVLALVDVAEHRLPNTIIATGIAALAVLLVIAAAPGGEWLRMLWALSGACAMFGVYLLLALASPRSMGMGDVKLGFLLGLLLGWFGASAWLFGLLAAFVIGGIIAVVALARRRVSLRDSIPFGPSMLAGALLVVLLAA